MFDLIREYKTLVNISRYAGDVREFKVARVIPTIVFSRNEVCAKISRFTVMIFELCSYLCLYLFHNSFVDIYSFKLRSSLNFRKIVNLGPNGLV